MGNIRGYSLNPKTGGYIATKEDDTPEAIMVRAYFVAKDILDCQAKQIEEQKKQTIDDDPFFLKNPQKAGYKP